MEVKKAQEMAMAFSAEILGKPCQVTSVTKAGNERRVLLEVVEEKGYLDDLLGVYQLTLDEQMNPISFERRGLRRRSDASPKEWEKSE